MREGSWTSEEENFLAAMQKQCEVHHTWNMKCYNYYDRLSNKFNIPILIISSINALTAISLNEFLNQTYVSILNAVLSAGTGVLGSIQLYMKLNEKMTKATRSAIMFKKLSLKISKELAIARGDRTTEGQSFLSDCFAEYNTTLEQGNPVDKQMGDFMTKGRALVTEPPSPVSVRSVAHRLLALANVRVDRDRTPPSDNEVV
jgi:uncharacterized membrane protein YdfJ with MMPL/SSD domain